MNNLKRNVFIHKDVLKDFTIEDSFFPVNSKDVGVAALSEVQDSLHILRIYQLLFDEFFDAFIPVNEMVAFSFHNRDELEGFLKGLPHLNGLEMLMLLNPIQDLEAQTRI